MKLFQSQVLKNQKLNSQFHHLFLQVKEKGFDFLPGQFTVLKVADSIYRSYSIASSPSKLPNWEMIVDIGPGGPGTTFLKKLKKGQIIQATQPRGELFLKEDQTKNLLFIATGCGIASIKAMLEKLFEEQKTSQKIFLLWGLRYQKDIFLNKLLSRWRKKNLNFNYRITFSREPETKICNTKIGRVYNHLEEVAKNLNPRQTSCYLCGGKEMVQDTTPVLIKLGFPKKRIYAEKYY